MKTIEVKYDCQPDQVKKRVIGWRKTHFPNSEEWWYAQNLLGDVLGWPQWYSDFINSVKEGGK